MRYVILVIALVVLTYLVLDFNARTAELNRLRAEQEVIAARVEAREGTKRALEAQIAYATSEVAVAEWAYSNHMAQPGDYVVVPVNASEVTPTPAPRPVVVQPEVSNWQRWLMLFADP